MAIAAHTGNARAAIYAGLQRRNRVVAVLRIAVPVAGAVLFGVLGAQLVTANLSHDFTIGRVSVAENRLNVAAPSYAGRLSDGSTFAVSAETAEAALDASNIIDLTGAQVLLNRPDGTEVTARAGAAELDTEAQAVVIPGVTDIAEKKGTTAKVTGLRVEVVSQMVTAGPVTVRLADGPTLDAATMRYDVAAKLWHFEKVTLMLPSTPGEEKDTP
jgi:hypothetical protein